MEGFDDLRQRFLSINEHTNEPDRAIKRIGAMAARRVKKLADAGFLDQRIGNWPLQSQVYDPNIDADELWFLTWRGIGQTLAHMFPDQLPADIGVVSVYRRESGIVQGTLKPEDWQERAQDHAAVCALLDKLVPKGSSVEAGAAKSMPAVPVVKPAKGISKKGKALAALVDHPDWTDEQIADAAGCHVKSLYRMRDFVTARAALRGGRDSMPVGTKDGDSGDMEAWNDDE
jgi:hypothetical protein